MTSLVAIGAGLAALTGIGAGVGIGIATSRQQMQSQDSRKQKERLLRHYYLVVPLQKVLQFSVWL